MNFASPIPGAAPVEVGRNQVPRSYTSSPDTADPDVPSSSLEFNPPIRLLLELMDIDDPSPTFKYVDFENELRKFNVRGILDVHRLPTMLLATFGDLKDYGARHLQAYVKERLMPLIKPGRKVKTEEGGSGSVVTDTQEGGSGSVVADTQEVDEICKLEYLDACSDVAVEDGGHTTGLWKGKGRLLKEESREVIMVWPSDEEDDDALPPIEVLHDDAGTASESSESFHP